MSLSRDESQDQDFSLKTRTGWQFFVTEAAAVFLLLGVPLSVQAGLFNNLVGLVAVEATAIEAIETTDYSPTQTPLLSASTIDPVAATGGGDIIVNGDAIVAGAPVTEAERKEAQNNGEISVYTVREGDTLSQIAEMYGVTTNTILWANDVEKASNVQPGDVLVILPIVGVQHTVKKGETLASLVKKYDADMDEVLDYNSLSSADEISVGDEIIIPGGTIAAPKYAGRPAPKKSSGGGASLGFTHPAPGAVRTQGIHGYNGVDYGGAYGSAIRAAAAGEVIVSKSGWNGGYGNYIVIRHGNGTQTLYAHLSQNYVSVGQWVASGANIGAMGNSGRSTGTHLHFEVRGARNPF